MSESYTHTKKKKKRKERKKKEKIDFTDLHQKYADFKIFGKNTRTFVILILIFF